MRPHLPTGTVTFLFTDVEGSTRLLEEVGDEAYEEALSVHRRIVRAACQAHDGVEVDTQGDAFFFAFPESSGALAAAQQLTEGLASGPIQVRVGLHTGTPRLGEEGYFGSDVHFGARVAACAHGGQVVLSQETRDLVDGYVLTDLGEHRLKDIEHAVAIFQLGDESFPPLKTISNTNLPRPASSFVGREQELEEVLALIEEGARLVTLTGPGGSGKTRLALEAASTLVPEYKAGVFWVGLAALRDPALVTETIAQTLGAKDGLAEHFGERELLLLLDNLEQVVEAAPELASLLECCPNLALLVTSRELLRVRGEVEYPVPPLASPEAVVLFCERSGLALSEEIAELCARLDNLPLAVELAAARTKALTVAQIFDRLSQRLDLLKGGRDADPRQATLRATIEWSYDLLSPQEQQLFARLSIFAGGCTLEAAEEVTEADLDTLQSLVGKSLLRFSNERYWMLQTIREFAREQLAEHGDLARLELLLAHHIADRIDRVDPAIVFFADIANWRAALERTLAENDAELALVLFMGSGAWRLTQTELLYWNDRVVADTRQTPAGLGVLLRSRAGALWTQGDAVGAVEAAEEAVKLLRQHGSPDELALTVVVLGLVLSRGEEVDRARQTLEEGLALATTSSDRRAAIWALHSRGELERDQGNMSLAQSLLEQALAEAAAGGQPMATILHGLGDLALDRGKPEEAKGLYVTAVREATKTRMSVPATFSAAGLAGILAAEGRIAEAGRLWGAAQRMGEQIGHAFGDGAYALEVQRYEALLPAPDDEEFARAVAEGMAEDPLRVIHAALATLD